VDTGIRKEGSRLEELPRVKLPVIMRLAQYEYFTTIKNPVKAITQPGVPPPSASMGVEGVGSASGALEAMEKRVTKE